MTAPYYADDKVTLYLGDCREITNWLAADVLVTDPPYGRAWKQGETRLNGLSKSHRGIANDTDTSTRDDALQLWGPRLGILFGDLMLPPAPGTKQVLIYKKPPDAGHRGSMAGWRRNVEAIYLLGPWSTGLDGKRSSIVETQTARAGGVTGPAGRVGHPHAKPLDVMEVLISACPSGVIADPFAGSGSTLVAARNLGRRAIGVELEERYCEVIARRLAQDCLDFGESA